MGQKRTIITSLAVFLLAIAIPSASFATGYVFTPNPADLWDLDHSDVYLWGIDWDLRPGEVITDATITYIDINNWTYPEDDRLYTTLLNSAYLDYGSFSGSWESVTVPFQYDRRTGRKDDTTPGLSDYFSLWQTSPNGYLLGAWNDPGPGSTSFLSFDIPAAYFGWLGDGDFAFGIDPDCHYWNNGIELTIITRSDTQIPEPSTLILLGSGILGIWGLHRKIKK